MRRIVRGILTVLVAAYLAAAVAWAVWSCAGGPAAGGAGSRPAPATAAHRLPFDSSPATCSTRQCGEQRWLVKTLADGDRARIEAEPRDVTVRWLAAQDRPPHLDDDRRSAPVETSVFRVHALVLGWFTERDQDIHIVLADPERTDVTIIAEIPNPECHGACRSGMSRRFGELQARLHAMSPGPRLDTSRATLSAAVKSARLATITGVGFFDHKHHQIGVAWNAIELHPVLAIDFDR
jgi:hypothetical protein